MKRSTLNTVCRVEQKTLTKDSYGSPVESWSLLGVRYCALQDVLPSRSESAQGGLMTAIGQTRLRMNYCTDIDTSMRVVINRPARTIFNIVSGPAILGDKDEVEFMIEKIDG